MTWLEEERAHREALRAAFDRLQSAVTALGEEMRLGFARADARYDAFIGQMNTAVEKQNTAIEKQNTALERGLKEQTRFFFLAWAVLLATIVGLYAR